MSAVPETVTAPARTTLCRRVIPCLDVAGGRVVKGVRFEGLVDAGDPAEAAARYAASGADELVFLDVAATAERRGPALAWIERVAERVFVPLTVGGGVRSIDDALALLAAGADKVGVNTAAVERPELLGEIASRLGRQCAVLAVDARRDPERAGRWEVVTHGGRRPTGLDAVDWIERGVAAGSGELLVTSIDRDGTRDGFDVELISAVVGRVDVPVIASGGAGRLEHFAAALAAGASAVLAASLFHSGELAIPELKGHLAAQGFPMRGVGR
jgi:cyclase